MNNSTVNKICSALLLFAAVLCMLVLPSCSAHRKLRTMKKDPTMTADLSLSIDTSRIPLLSNPEIARDTLRIKDDEGNEFYLMKVKKDEENGDMVANETIDAAVVTARFRNVAERCGLVDLSFQVTIPASLQDSKWQLRFYPDMTMLGDSIRLDPVIITGRAYNKHKLRGYQQYDKLISEIVKDSTKFIDIRSLEIFMNRYLPEIYALKTDSSYVSDEQMTFLYGITQQQAVEHYTDKFARSLNNGKIKKKDRIYDKYIKAINGGHIRLDTVIIDSKGDFTYNYVQTIKTRPGLRKVDISLAGEIYDDGKRIFLIPSSPDLTFYISSLSIFTQEHVRYVTKVVERRAAVNTSSNIEFKVGRSDIDFSLGNNRQEIGRVNNTLRKLVSDAEFDLDSVVVISSASPDGSQETNESLALKRGYSISTYFKKQISNYQDSLNAVKSFTVDENGVMSYHNVPHVKIPFKSRSNGENWVLLDELVQEDAFLTAAQKKDYESLSKIRNLDKREQAMREKSYYPYLKAELYPKLRAVRFDFYMHRKGMVKDTVHTTEIDTMYRNGLAALKNMDYDTAIRLLAPYHDFNSAVAYMAMNRNLSAMDILSKLEKTAEVNYLMAILCSRTGDITKAIELYMQACKQNHAYVYRGNLDPEISDLIKTYGLNKEDDDDYLGM